MIDLIHAAGAAALLALGLLAALWIWLLRRAVKRHIQVLIAEHNKQRALFNATPDGLTVKDRNGTYIDCNDMAVRHLGTRRERMIGHTTQDIFGPAIGGVLERWDQAVMQNGQARIYADPYATRRAAGQYYEIVKVPLREPDGAPSGVLTIERNITERVQADAELRLAAVAFESQEALMITDAEGAIRRVNGAFTHLTGYTAAEVRGKLPAFLTAQQSGHAFGTEIFDYARNLGAWRGEQLLAAKSQHFKVVRTTVSATTDQGGAIDHFVCAMVDLTAERAARDSIDHLTFFDVLTNLPNRYLLHDHLQQLVRGGSGSSGALLAIDIDHFSRVNDLHGHVAGDALLILVAQRLRSLLDSHCVLARFGAGTFDLLVARDPRDTVTSQALGRRWSAKIHAAMHRPFQIRAETVVHITASIGWTEVSPDTTNGETALKQAELALYSAKAAGRDRCCRYQPAMQDRLQRRETLLADLRTAVANHALEPYIQAQTDGAGNIHGGEVLLRWTRANGERVSPTQFIPIAEDSGLILALGEWVLRRGCALLTSWADQPRLRDLVLAINVSARQFDQPAFVDTICRALDETGANPARLKLEITESVTLGDLAKVKDKLTRLRAHGIRFSLDDFGTGYSSLAYLSHLPLDELKIDRAFVSHLPQDANDAVVAQTILVMGHRLGINVLAEGVETTAQRDFLSAHGCTSFQGFLFARPVPVSTFVQRLAATTSNAETIRAS